MNPASAVPPPSTVESLKRDLGVRAPGEHTELSDVHDSQVPQENIGGAGQHLHSVTAAPSRPGSVESEIGNLDVSTRCDENRSVRRPGGSSEDRAGARPQQARAASQSYVGEHVAPWKESHRRSTHERSEAGLHAMTGRDGDHV